MSNKARDSYFITEGMAFACFLDYPFVLFSIIGNDFSSCLNGYIYRCSIIIQHILIIIWGWGLIYIYMCVKISHFFINTNFRWFKGSEK